MSIFETLSGTLIAVAACAAVVAADTPAAAPAVRDGAHDFDFNFGLWKTHIRRLKEPLSGVRDYVEMNGTVSVRKVWAGRAQLEEIEVDAPGGHWEGLTLFLYDPKAHQWSQTYVGSADASITPGMIGEFRDGRGELFGQESLHGRTVLVRGVWSDIKPNSHHFEIAYSQDGGRNWEPSFIADLIRLQP